MLHFAPGSHAQIFFSLLSVVGEYPSFSLYLLGSGPTYKKLIRKMLDKQTVRQTETGEEISTRMITVSGNGKDKTIRIYKGALPILKWIGADRYYPSAFDNHHFRGDSAHRERNHRVAEAVAMSMRAGFEYRPYKLATLQNSEIKRVVSNSPAFYTAKQLKAVGAIEGNKTLFTRVVGALFAGGDCYAVYNTREATMKWSGMGELKTLYSLTDIARLNAGIGQVTSAVLFGSSYEVAIRTLLESDKSRKTENRFDSIYRHIHFVPLSDFGIRKLRLMAIPKWKEKILSLLFDARVRSYDQGQFEYDAYIGGKYVYSFLDGDIARLIRFQRALDSVPADSMELLCFPEEVSFINSYFAGSIKIKTISLSDIEKAFAVK